MAQADFNLLNSTGAVFRSRVNEVNAAIKSSNSGPSAPSDPVAGMLWFKTDTNEVFVRNASNTAWEDIRLPLTQTQAEDPASTVFGTVSGQRLGQGVRANLNATGSAPIYACRAWVNFDGTTTTPTIRASGNVSSVTRNGTGDYTVNFTNAMPDANYTTTVACDTNLGANSNINAGTYPGGVYSTSGVGISVHLGSTGNFDRDVVNVAIFR